MNPKEAAAKLGVSEPTLKRWVKAGHVRAVKLGRLWDISERDIDGFRKEHRLADGRVGLRQTRIDGQHMRMVLLQGDPRAARAKGGHAVAAKYGREHFVNAGRKGAEAKAERYWPTLKRDRAAREAERVETLRQIAINGQEARTAQGVAHIKTHHAEAGHHSGLIARGLPPRRPIRGGLPRLRSERENAGFTQQQLAHISGVHFGTIINLELGLTAPRDWTIRRLASALGITPERLVEAER